MANKKTKDSKKTKRATGHGASKSQDLFRRFKMTQSINNELERAVVESTVALSDDSRPEDSAHADIFTAEEDKAKRARK